MSDGITKVLFLDRDGTINVERGYINDLSMLELIPGVGEALLKAKRAGFKLAMITNQAGVGRGLTPPEMPEKIQREIEKRCGVEFDDARVCPHKPDDACACRKPGTLNLMRSIEALQADVTRSFFIGDHLRDLECGSRAGVRTILVLTGHGKDTHEELKQKPDVVPHHVAQDLAAAVEWILAQH
jgi:D-glycero-D-manno-heptose 1,7-bisphosphate phosphatase